MVEAGDVVGGRYRLENLLGSGGFGAAWRAYDLRIGRIVVVKAGLAETEEAVRRFMREAHLAGALTHPNVAVVHDVGEFADDGRTVVYLVMEYVAGTDLAGLLERGLPGFAESVGWARQICSALAVAHDVGIVHRDIKPANVMVTESGVVKVLDFGIAKRWEGQTALTAEGFVVGSFPYMTPERWRGTGVDGRADLYALGCVLVELWTGRPAFTGQDPVELLTQHVTAEPPAPSKLRPGLPPGADRMVADLLAKDPADRPADAREVERRLAELVGTGSTVVVPPSRVPPVPGRRPYVAAGGFGQAVTPSGGGTGGTGGTSNGVSPAATDVRGQTRSRLDQLTELIQGRPYSSDTERQLRVFAGDTAQRLGPQDPATTAAELLHLGYVVRRSPEDPGPVLPRLAAVLERASETGLGPLDPAVLYARIDQAYGGLREFRRGRERHRTTTTAQRARRDALAPLLPDLAQGLPADDLQRREVCATVAQDSYALGDFEQAALLWDALVPLPPYTSSEPPSAERREAVLRHVRAAGEGGRPERALELLAELARFRPVDSGYTDLFWEEVGRLRSRYGRLAERRAGDRRM
ncbi:protein kinase [Streptomyces sp. NPDC006463]|uniref:serine/threonine-protein kinase n=1 Tax=Streptomyces sp. NPDC006463 TaxID=3364746 RepID=UPI0036A8956E